MAANFDLHQRLDFIGLDDDAFQHIRDAQAIIARALPKALDKLYAKVQATPKTRSLFRDAAHIAGAKSAQARHWQKIADARFDEEYATTANRIGHTHARIGLEPRWYIGGYALVTEMLIGELLDHHWPRGFMSRANVASASSAISAIVKAVMLDMDIAISTYIEAMGQERAEAEAVLGTNLAKLAGNDMT